MNSTVGGTTFMYQCDCYDYDDEYSSFDKFVPHDKTARCFPRDWNDTECGDWVEYDYVSVFYINRFKMFGF